VTLRTKEGILEGMSTDRFARPRAMQRTDPDESPTSARPTVVPKFDPASVARSDWMPTAIPPPPAASIDTAPPEATNDFSRMILESATYPIDRSPSLSFDAPILELEEVHDQDSDSYGELEEVHELEELPQLEEVHEDIALPGAHAEDELRASYIAQIGSLERVPFLNVSLNDLRTLPLDNRAGFLLSRVDGVSSIDMIVDVSGMPEIEVLEIICELLRQGVVDMT
jgi:hypothetical protein